MSNFFGMMSNFFWKMSNFFGSMSNFFGKCPTFFCVHYIPSHPASDAWLDLPVFFDPQLDRQWKLSTYYLERNSNFLLLLRNCLFFIIFLRSASHYLPVYGIISWCPMYQLLQTYDNANSLLEIQATCMSMSITLVFWDVYFKIWNYEGWNLRQNL